MNESKKIEEILAHHGIKGQRWGVRRYQNKDGSLTPLGEKRMDKLNARKTAEDLKDRKVARKLTIQKAKQDRKQDELDRAAARKNEAAKAKAEVAAAKQKAKTTADDEEEELYDVPDARAEAERQKRISTGKKILIGTVAVIGTVAAAYAFKKWREKVGAATEGEKTAEDAVKDVVEKVKETKISKKDIRANDKKTKGTIDNLEREARKLGAEKKALEKKYLKGKMTVAEYNAAKQKQSAKSQERLSKMQEVLKKALELNPSYYSRHKARK